MIKERGKKMKLTHNRKLEIAIGVSFIIATICYASGSSMVAGALSNPLVNLSALSTGVLLEIGNSIAVIALGVLFLERLKNKNRTLVIGYAITRAIEAVLLMVGSVVTLFALKSSSGETLEGLFVLHEAFFSVAMLVLGIYSTLFFVYLFKESVGPKWLMGLGVLGYLMTSIYALIMIGSGLTINPLILFAPGGIFEILLPLWLIFKGFE